jgi:hypothetical protein
MRTLVLFLAAAIAGFGADVTGTWTGTFTPEGRDPQAAKLVLKQEGSTVTGTAGPAEEAGWEIRKGRVEDGVITFELEQNNMVMRFNLKLTGDDISGDVERERDGQKQNARLAVKREKS